MPRRVYICPRWLETVRGLRMRRSAISAVVNPCAPSRATSSSRWLSRTLATRHRRVAGAEMPRPRSSRRARSAWRRAPTRSNVTRLCCALVMANSGCLADSDTACSSRHFAASNGIWRAVNILIASTQASYGGGVLVHALPGKTLSTRCQGSQVGRASRTQIGQKS